MPKSKCVPCLGRDIRAAILQEVKDEEVRQALDKIPECPEPRGIEVCGRRVSAYQQFVSDCMKAKHLKGLDPAAMGDCAAQWKKRK